MRSARLFPVQTSQIFTFLLRFSQVCLHLIISDSPVNVRLRRQSQLNTQRRSHESRSSASSRPSRFAPVHLQSTPEPSTAASSHSGTGAGASGISRHIATDYTDTTPGAIHKYYDENGGCSDTVLCGGKPTLTI